MNNTEYLSIKELAAIAGVSKQSIYKRLKRENDPIQPFVKRENNQVTIDKAAVQAIYRVQEADKNSTNESTIQPNSTKVEQPQDTNKELIEMLRRQLETKDKQIEDLNNRLSESLKALDQQQQLAAIDKKKILELEDKLEKQGEEDSRPAANTNDTEEAAPAADRQEEQSKRSFWQWFFRR